MKKPNGRARQLLEALKAYQPQRVILFGSRARGDARRFSDVDLVVIKDTPEKFRQRFLTVRELLGPLGDSYDVIVYTPREWQEMIAEGTPFVEEVLREGVVLHGGPLEKIDFSEARMEGRKRVGEHWLGQAEDDLRLAKHDLEGGFANAACFCSQQAAEKALKAVFYAMGERGIRHHSVEKLCQDLASTHPQFGPLAPLGKRLDPYYVATRYPNHRRYREPADFSRAEGEKAIHMAQQIVAEAREALEGL